MPVAIATFLALLLAVSAAAARADQTYTVLGDDRYQIGTAATPTQIVYDGTQRLAIHPDGKALRFVADATYTRLDETGKATVHARFVQQMAPDGSFDDREDDDPDFLTILNQPFAIELDARTMRDVRSLRGRVPFQATSPLGGARLRGYLRPARSGTIAGIAVAGVRFSAEGPMSGTLPQHPEDALGGTIHMDGTAYYSLHGALLVALDATLSIDGNLKNDAVAVPVKIVYHRTIRAGNATAPNP